MLWRGKRNVLRSNLSHKFNYIYKFEKYIGKDNGVKENVSINPVTHVFVSNILLLQKHAHKHTQTHTYIYMYIHTFAVFYAKNITQS